MDLERLAIPEVVKIKPVRHGDHRGFFSETYKKHALQEAGLTADFIQDHHSRSTQRGVVRGLHWQAPPSAQGKLIRVVRGAIFDVAVDIRTGSPTYGQHVAAKLSDDNWAQLWVPPGFAHGFYTLTDVTEVIYKVDAPYDPAAEQGLLWNDPALGIAWPVGSDQVLLSAKDEVLPSLAALRSPFVYGQSD